MYPSSLHHYQFISLYLPLHFIKFFIRRGRGRSIYTRGPNGQICRLNPKVALLSANTNRVNWLLPWQRRLCSSLMHFGRISTNHMSESKTSGISPPISGWEKFSYPARDLPRGRGDKRDQITWAANPLYTVPFLLGPLPFQRNILTF